MGFKQCGCRGKCRCQKKEQVVYPVQEEVKHGYSEETVRHVHPSHTTFVNNHTIRNEHVYPHSTSYETRVNEVDVQGVNEGPGNDVRGISEGPGRGYRGVRGVRDDRYRCNDMRAGGAKHCGCRGRCNCHSRRRRRRSWL